MASTASAWMELNVRADLATIEVERDGSAVVRHEMLLGVRGGPLRRFSIEGIDADATPLDTATIVIAKSGQAAGVPMALLVERQGDRLDFEITYKKGLHTGTYLVEFSYQTDLYSRGFITANNGSTELTWLTPRFPSGIDSLRARFVLPAGEPPPRLLSPEAPAETRDGIELVATEEGVFLSQHRREGERDILELTRPHTAKHEQASWKLVLAPGLFGEHALERPVTAVQHRGAVRSGSTAVSRDGLWGIAGVSGLLYALLLWLKHRWLCRAGGDVGTGVRFLIRFPLGLRLLAVGFAVAGAIATGLIAERATFSALLLGVAIVLAIQLPAPERARARGPGSWVTVNLEDELWTSSTPRGFGRWLDAATLPGFCLFLVCELLLTILALRSLGEAPYRSAALLAYSMGLVPLFFTLGQAQIGQSLLDLQRRALRPLVVQLEKRRVPFALLGRVVSTLPSNQDKHSDAQQIDEYRVQLDVPNAKHGLTSLELAVELIDGTWLLVPQPVFILKLRDDSPAYASLPRFVLSRAQWSRGRHSDERVGLLRLSLPSVGLTVDTAQKLTAALSGSQKTKTPKDSAPPAPQRARVFAA